jgi:hypothetical protein
MNSTTQQQVAQWFFLGVFFFIMADAYGGRIDTLYANQDAVILSRKAKENYKHDVVVACGRATSAGVPDTIRSLIRFDLSGIPKSATIIKAMLYLSGDLHVLDNFPVPFQACRLDAKWEENKVTWANQPKVLSASVIAEHPGVTTVNEVVVMDTIEVVKHVQDMVKHPEKNFGWVLKLKEENGAYTLVRFGSKEHRKPEKFPMLVVEY